MAQAVAKITAELDTLLEFYNYPAQHWKHLRTTNPIESSFATVRLRQRVTKGPGSWAAGIAMAFKLIETRPRPMASHAPASGRDPHGRHLVARVRAGDQFVNGYAVEENPQNPSQSGGDHQAA